MCSSVLRSMVKSINLLGLASVETAITIASFVFNTITSIFTLCIGYLTLRAMTSERGRFSLQASFFQAVLSAKRSRFLQEGTTPPTHLRTVNITTINTLMLYHLPSAGDTLMGKSIYLCLEWRRGIQRSLRGGEDEVGLLCSTCSKVLLGVVNRTQKTFDQGVQAMRLDITGRLAEGGKRIWYIYTFRNVHNACHSQLQRQDAHFIPTAVLIMTSYLLPALLALPGLCFAPPFIFLAENPLKSPLDIASPLFLNLFFPP